MSKTSGVIHSQEFDPLYKELCKVLTSICTTTGTQCPLSVCGGPDVVCPLQQLNCKEVTVDIWSAYMRSNVAKTAKLLRRCS